MLADPAHQRRGGAVDLAGDDIVARVDRAEVHGFELGRRDVHQDVARSELRGVGRDARAIDAQIAAGGRRPEH